MHESDMAFIFIFVFALSMDTDILLLFLSLSCAYVVKGIQAFFGFINKLFGFPLMVI